MKTKVYSNWRVEVFPEEPFYFRRKTNEEQHKYMLNEIGDLQKQIKRHVDSAGAVVRFDTGFTCEHCGSNWTEDSDTYNGGCCDEDELNNPDSAVMVPVEEEK
jgi:hypothetical protein